MTEVRLCFTDILQDGCVKRYNGAFQLGGAIQSRLKIYTLDDDIAGDGICNRVH